MTLGELIALDTSVALPLLTGTHPDHAAVLAWARERRVALTAHSLAETYSVLTRIRSDLRARPADAAARVRRGFVEMVAPTPETTERVADILAAAGIAGGATYDGLVALTARDGDVTLATRDRRAVPTYQALGVRVEIVG